MIYVIYNTKSKYIKNKKFMVRLRNDFPIDSTFLDCIGLNYDELFNEINKDDKVYLVGGDGTLNHFVNYVDGKTLPCECYFYAAGTGNDFVNDNKERANKNIVYLNDCISDLPIVYVNGLKRRFVNGIGYGIDGYCCEVADNLASKGKKVNYTSIALGGLMGKYKFPNAKVNVDGEIYEFKKVLLAPTMKGRFYGGGMMITPMQDRFNKDRTLTFAIVHDASRLKILSLFPKIFKGTHVKYSEIYTYKTCKHIVVEFDTPTALQIDGETVLNVLKYEVSID